MAPSARSITSTTLPISSARNLAIITALGFASGLPLALTLLALPVWFAYDHLSLQVTGLTACIGLPYTCKFLWAPVFDEVPPPFGGRRRGWLIPVQMLLLLGVFGLAMSDPVRHVVWVFVVGVALAFISASQDILIDAWRIETFEQREQGVALAGYVWGYRVAMLCAGPGVMWLSVPLGWHVAVLAMLPLALAGPVAALLAAEPAVDRLAELAGFAARFTAAVWAPLNDIWSRQGAALIIAFILVFRLGEALATGVLSKYYFSLGYTRLDIAQAFGPFSLAATLAGAAAGGWMVVRFGTGRTLLLSGVFQTAVLLVYPALTFLPHAQAMLVLVSMVESFASTFAEAGFLTYLSGLCNREYTATQYALLSSLPALALRTIGGFSGFLAADLGYLHYFIASTCAALPAMALMLVILRYYPPKEGKE
jgi:PAT family beta-lactamase induction signal transducer AmpG